MAAEVAGVPDGNGEIVARLPLHVEFEVEGVGELVAHVVGAKVEGGGGGASAVRLIDDAGTSGFHGVERGELLGEERRIGGWNGNDLRSRAGSEGPGSGAGDVVGEGWSFGYAEGATGG